MTLWTLGRPGHRRRDVPGQVHVEPRDEHVENAPHSATWMDRPPASSRRHRSSTRSGGCRQRLSNQEPSLERPRARGPRPRYRRSGLWQRQRSCNRSIQPVPNVPAAPSSSDELSKLMHGSKKPSRVWHRSSPAGGAPPSRDTPDEEQSLSVGFPSDDVGPPFHRVEACFEGL
jgi:hypothetical protein